MTRPPAWFRLLLHLLPSRFRDAHGEEIGEIASQYAHGRSRLSRALVWVRAGLDVLNVAISARLGVPNTPHGTRRGPPRGPFAFEGLAQDVRYGLQSLRREAGFATLVTLIVGLGVGASVTVFSVAHALLLRPLAFADPERLVWISNGDWGRGQQLSEITVQVAYLNELRAHAEQLVDVGGYHLFDGVGDHALTFAAEPERVTRLRVTENLFAVLGIEPVHGRLFTAEEAWDDGPPAIVLTYGFFERRFASDPAIVGQAVSVDGAPTNVVGVLPPSFDFNSMFAPGRRVDYVVPFPLSERSNRTGNTLGLVARLSPGATLETATAEARALAARTQSQRLNGFEPVIRPLREHVSGGFRPAIVVLIGAVALVMLIVCANVSNLLLARGATRDREMAIRAAIGAPRRRLIRQMLAESLLLSGAGAALGLGLAYFGTDLLASLDLRIALLSQARVDGPSLAFALAAALVVGVVFGVAPALRGTDVRLHESLKDSARGSSEGRRQPALRSALVVSEVALACILMIVSTLMARSLLEVLDVDLGYRSERAVAIRIDPSVRWASDDERDAFYTEVLDRMRTAPGAIVAGLSDVLPMGFNRRWDVRDPALPPEDRGIDAFVRVVSDGYVDAMGLSLVAGRDLARQDSPDAPRVALVSEGLAARMWPGAEPLGRMIRGSGREYTVVGVVRDTRQLSVEQEPGPEMFFSIRQLSDHDAVHLILRGERAFADLVATARTELRAIDPTLPLDHVVAIQDVVDASIAPRRFLVGLLSAFAAFALILASLGIYGVISYSVTQRRREIGIHIALGASAGAVQSRIVRQTLTLAVVGLTVGLPVAASSARLLEGLLFGVTPLDPTTYLVVVLLLGGVAGAAGYLPARRAARANPLDSLSGEGVRAT